MSTLESLTRAMSARVFHSEEGQIGYVERGENGGIKSVIPIYYVKVGSKRYFLQFRVFKASEDNETYKGGFTARFIVVDPDKKEGGNVCRWNTLDACITQEFGFKCSLWLSCFQIQLGWLQISLWL